MRSGKFINQLSGDMQYSAFIPNPLPFDVGMDDTLQRLLSDADMAIGRLDGISAMIPDVDFFILMYVRKEATLSSQVEGTQATFSDVLKVEANVFDNEVHSDVDEVINYIDAMNHGLNRLKELPLSLRLIKEIHERLLKGVRGAGKAPGEFRRIQNWIGGPTLNTAQYIPPAPHEIMLLLYNLEKFFHEASSIPILIKAGLIHSQFEAIHPFLDGNGRIGRLLITYYLCQQGILKKPLLYISQYFKQYRQVYYDRLQGIHGKDDIEGWLKFFLTGVIETAIQAQQTVQAILDLRARDVERILQLGKSSKNGHCLLERLFRTPLIRIKDVEKITGLKNPNAIALTNKMEAIGILKEITGKKRNRVYQYDEYIKMFEMETASV